MLEIAWQVFTAFALFILGAIAFAAQPFRAVPSILSVIVYFCHTVFCFYYAIFAIYNTSDASGYFIRSFGADLSFALGTRAIDYITSIFTQVLGFSYIGTFLVFGLFGAYGVLAILAALLESLKNKSRRVRSIAITIAFLPGLNFWSAAIGKDSIAVLGTGLLCWSALDFKRRWVAFIAGVLVYTIVRPHISGVVVFSFIMAITLSGKISAVKKFVILSALALPAAYAVQLTLSAAGFGESGAFNNIDELIDYRESVNTSGGSSIDISSMILPQKMFYYSFMPLFVGMGGVMGLVASLENTFLLIIAALCMFRIFRRRSSLDSTSKWFFLFFSVSLWVIFAMTTTNLGIALRQKWMFMPMLLLYLMSFLPERRYQPTAPFDWRARPDLRPSSSSRFG
ncbi:hypothetical protein [Ancylobacter sp. TS-1]|uniref:hypothetical protein n=1 Tax=Ancylobacter sp. TS-1 TaxID=1850374 RepID=UPI001265CA93|nr:hypothetical protein [Ancylobacter sp. TS-1]QFR33436.1 hypothetical protein GBB76_09985 [Ancylobacter sp. TS-1]